MIPVRTIEPKMFGFLPTVDISAVRLVCNKIIYKTINKVKKILEIRDFAQNSFEDDQFTCKSNFNSK